MDSATAALLTEIAGCPLVADALSAPHPCSGVVGTQKPAELGIPRQVPEPWSGHLERAPVLFLSSNPSISGAEVYPRATWVEPGREPDRGAWPVDQLIDYFDGRFDTTPGRPAWIRDGIRTQLPDRTFSKYVRFLAAVRARAAELYDGVLERRPVPGADYCLTEVVHCKSTGERGVKAAMPTCAERYLGQVLACSPAPVVISLGDIAAAALLSQPGSGITSSAIHTVFDAELGGRRRLVVFLPHPNRRGMIKKLAAVPAGDRGRLRDALAAHSPG